MKLASTVANTREGSGPGPGARCTVLVVAHAIDASAIGRRIAPPAGRLLLGRGETALGPGLLDDPRLSRRHAELIQDAGGLYIEDLASRNGTRVNGEDLRRRALRPGDLVSLGHLLLVVREELAGTRPPPGDMVGVSGAMSALYDQVQLAGRQPGAVLVLGEPGVGKDVVARALHRASGRRGEYVALNCGAMSDELLMSELYGHERGAYSGAQRDRAGLVATAAGGTLFLDEIGDASPAFQASLLRLLENGEVRAVGSDRLRRADVQVVAATNRDLEADAASGRFRADLLGRIARWPLIIPPLRERREDVPLLALHFARRAAGRDLSLNWRLAQDLALADWPGNVRELSAAVERLVVEAAGADTLAPPTWPLSRRLPRPAVEPAPEAAPERPSPEALRAALAASGGSMKALAARLGVGRTTLYRWFNEAGIQPDEARRES